MKAVVWHGIGDIRLDDVKEPRIEQPTDAIVRLTASAICGTDLHLVRGTVTKMKPGTILGHEGVGIIEALGSEVRNFTIGDRVVIPSTIGCGTCEYCRAGYYSQCDRANPHGKRAGTAFFGGPATSGPFHGLQAEMARIPFAHVGLVKLPDEVTDQQAIVLSDIFPTAFFGATLAQILPGNTVAVFGCGPVGLLTIVSAKLMDAGRVFAVDRVPSRLAKARELGAEIINFDEEDPVEALLCLTDGNGVDRAIDAVGVDAARPHHGPAAKQLARDNELPELDREVRTVAPDARPRGDLWVPGDAPSLALMWATTALRKYGTLAVIGVYPKTVKLYPIGEAMGKNLTIRLGNCDHRAFIPPLLERVRSGAVDPERVLSHLEPLQSAIDAYQHFDLRDPGWIKVELTPASAH
jgi:threonine dehydrogenase-like Zn-dependent dehydrogenase